jgi:hypothetical protein
MIARGRGVAAADTVGRSTSSMTCGPGPARPGASDGDGDGDRVAESVPPRAVAAPFRGTVTSPPGGSSYQWCPSSGWPVDPGGADGGSGRESEATGRAAASPKSRRMSSPSATPATTVRAPRSNPVVVLPDAMRALNAFGCRPGAWRRPLVDDRSRPVVREPDQWLPRLCARRFAVRPSASGVRPRRWPWSCWRVSRVRHGGRPVLPAILRTSTRLNRPEL